MSKIIITCAVTGSIHTPSMSPYLPVTAKDIAAQAIGAAKAGAAILHLHARDPQTGRPSASVDHYRAFLPAIGAGCYAVVNLTTGGSAVMTLEDRLAAPLALRPEMCSLNMGSMNFALYPMLGRRTEWLHDWEEPFLRNSDDLVFKNTPRDIEGVLRRMSQERGARFEFECYDVSHLYMLRHCGSRPCRGACFHPVRDGRSGRHRRRTGASRSPQGDRRPAFRRGLQLFGPGRRAPADAPCRTVGRDGRTCARRP